MNATSPFCALNKKVENITEQLTLLLLAAAAILSRISISQV